MPVYSSLNFALWALKSCWAFWFMGQDERVSIELVVRKCRRAAEFRSIKSLVDMIRNPDLPGEQTRVLIAAGARPPAQPWAGRSRDCRSPPWPHPVFYSIHVVYDLCKPPLGQASPKLCLCTKVHCLISLLYPEFKSFFNTSTIQIVKSRRCSEDKWHSIPQHAGESGRGFYLVMTSILPQACLF